MNVLYALSTYKFFLEGPCGRVSHATGFVAGVAGSEKNVTMLSGPGVESYVDDHPCISHVICSSKVRVFWWMMFLFRLFVLARTHNTIVVRWRPVLSLMCIPLLLINRNVWFEVNSLTGVNSRRWFVRGFSLISVKFLAAFFRVIVVSDVSKSQIEKISPIKQDIVVMPNGFVTTGFDSFVPTVRNGDLPNVVYFGKRQDYYDWDALYDVCSSLIQDGMISGLHIFGFDESHRYDWARFYGEFDRASLLNQVSNIVNPILIIHPSDSPMARAGSPMKLFEYAALSVPTVVGSALRAQCRRFPEFVYFSSGNRLSLREALSEVSLNYACRSNLASNSRKTAFEYYSWPATVRPWVMNFVR